MLYVIYKKEITMFGFLGFLLIIFLLIVFIGFTILGNILRVLLGIGKRTPYQNQTNDKNENFAESSPSSSNKRSHSSENRKKIFDDDEGEYVDYEEVK